MTVRPPFGRPDCYTIDVSRLERLKELYVEMQPSDALLAQGEPLGQLLVIKRWNVKATATGLDVPMQAAWVREVAMLMDDASEEERNAEEADLRAAPGEGAADMRLGRAAQEALQAGEAPAAGADLPPLAATLKRDLGLTSAEALALEQTLKRHLVRNAEGGYDLELDNVVELRGRPLTRLDARVFQTLQAYAAQNGGPGITCMSVNADQMPQGDGPITGLTHLTSLRWLGLTVPPRTRRTPPFNVCGLPPACRVDVQGARDTGREKWYILKDARTALAINGLLRDPLGQQFFIMNGSRVEPSPRSIRGGRSIPHGSRCTPMVPRAATNWRGDWRFPTTR